MESLPSEIILNYIVPYFYESLFDAFSFKSLMLTSKYFHTILSKNQEFIVRNYNKIPHKEYYIKHDFKTVKELVYYQNYFFFPFWLTSNIPQFRQLPIFNQSKDENLVLKTPYSIIKGIALFYPYLSIKCWKIVGEKRKPFCLTVFSNGNYNYRGDWLMNSSFVNVLSKNDKEKIILLLQKNTIVTINNYKLIM